MKLSLITILLCTVTSIVAAPQSSSTNSLDKRKGGGGGGRSSGGTSSGGRSGGSSGGGGGRSLSSYSFSPQSNLGGRTRDGSGTPKQYGNRYTGGAVTPYTANGARSPSRGIAPYALPIAAVAFFPALWLFPVWAYGYPVGYHWYANGRNMTSNVTCLCQDYGVCGCDPDDNSTFLANVLTDGGNGGPPVNSTNVRTIDWGNGTIASYINGTLDNGTTSNGGSDPSNEDQISPAARVVIDYAGYWIMMMTVVAGVTLI